MSTKKIVMICVGILLVAAVVTFLIFNTEPIARSEGASRESAMLVEVISAEHGSFRPVFEATGTVQPVEDIVLSPLVSGQIIRRSSAFIPGGFVQKGEVLLQIDPSDYRNILEMRRSELQQRQTDLEMEMGRQEVAEQDLELAGVDSLSAQERDLVLRQPQLEAIRATLRGAQAAVQQEELNLNRTTIRAPFDAHILTQMVTVGSQVAPGDILGRLVGSKNYWVILTIPVSQLQWLVFPESEEENGPTVKIRNTTAWPRDVFREGFLDNQVGALDEQTRLARVLVRVPDPLAREKQDKPELIIGSFVEAELPGKEIEDVVRLNRDYVRTNETVWVMQEGKLEIRDVEIVLNDSRYAYIKEGLAAGEKVVTTNLSTVANGIPLRNSEEDSVSGPESFENRNPEY